MATDRQGGPDPGAHGSGGSAVSALLRPFARVHRAEVTSALLLALAIFLLMVANYLLKVVREPLIMTGGGAEVKSYASAGQVLLLAGVVFVYDKLATRCDRMRLIGTINLFFISNLFIFYVLGRIGLPLGVPFFLWVGVFNVTVVTQLWSLANDLFTPEQGERVLPVVGIGGSAGAVVGAYLARGLIQPLGPLLLMLLSAVVLGCFIVSVAVLHRRELRLAAPRQDGPRHLAPVSSIGGTTRSLQLVLGDRYLLLIAALTLLLNWVSSMGEYIIDRHLLETIRAQLAGSDAPALAATVHYIGSFRATYFAWVNIVGLLLQCFVTARLVAKIGVPLSLFVMPCISLGGYTLMALLPVLAVITVTKIAENGLNYSLENTARQALFLVTSREAKYKAKTLIDTFFQRAGDLLSAGVVWVGAVLAFHTTQFVWANIVLVLLWLAVMVGIARLHREQVDATAVEAS